MSNVLNKLDKKKYSVVLIYLKSGRMCSNIYNIYKHTGFELTYRDSGNTIHFSIFTMQIFPPSQKITIPKYYAVSYS